MALGVCGSGGSPVLTEWTSTGPGLMWERIPVHGNDSGQMIQWWRNESWSWPKRIFESDSLNDRSISQTLKHEEEISAISWIKQRVRVNQRITENQFWLTRFTDSDTELLSKQTLYHNRTFFMTLMTDINTPLFTFLTENRRGWRAVWLKLNCFCHEWKIHWFRHLLIKPQTNDLLIRVSRRPLTDGNHSLCVSDRSRTNTSQ